MKLAHMHTDTHTKDTHGQTHTRTHAHKHTDTGADRPLPLERIGSGAVYPFASTQR